MAHADTAVVVRTVRAPPYFSALLFAYALPITATDAQLIEATQQALADYQPYTSKFDYLQQGRGGFTAAEARGLALFNDVQRDNCNSCHTSTA